MWFITSLELHKFSHESVTVEHLRARRVLRCEDCVRSYIEEEDEVRTHREDIASIAKGVLQASKARFGLHHTPPATSTYIRYKHKQNRMSTGDSQRKKAHTHTLHLFIHRWHRGTARCCRCLGVLELGFPPPLRSFRRFFEEI